MDSESDDQGQALKQSGILQGERQETRQLAHSTHQEVRPDDPELLQPNHRPQPGRQDPERSETQNLRYHQRPRRHWLHRKDFQKQNTLN